MGSEMCIRDRQHAADDGLDGGAALAGDLAADEVVGLDAGGALVDCLLYTSDAADERSSVDLGGRRIIKKNKDDRPEREVDTDGAQNTLSVKRTG